jgi:hypothetical protein
MRLACALLAVGIGAGCADASPQVRVGTSADFSPPARPTVSVFGVFHDGRMSTDSWAPLSGAVSSALGKSSCAVGWGAGLRQAEPELAQWVDDSARDNGVTDEMLGRVSTRAQGDFVMTLMVYKHMPRSRAGDPAARARARAGPPVARRRGYGRRPRLGPEEPEDRVFELSASLYSVRGRRMVAEIDLRYAGDDLDEAMKAFATKLRGLLPGASCVGWKWPEPVVTDDD